MRNPINPPPQDVSDLGHTAISVLIGDIPLSMTLDSGAICSTIRFDVLERLNAQPQSFIVAPQQYRRSLDGPAVHMPQLVLIHFTAQEHGIDTRFPFLPIEESRWEIIMGADLLRHLHGTLEPQTGRISFECPAGADNCNPDR